MAFSMRLLSISNTPSSAERVNASQRFTRHARRVRFQRP
jgi:hypothetical protein